MCKIILDNDCDMSPPIWVTLTGLIFNYFILFPGLPSWAVDGRPFGTDMGVGQSLCLHIYKRISGKNYEKK